MSRKLKVKRKPKYNSEETLQLISLQKELEESARRLYENACCGSKDFWSRLRNPESFKQDTVLINNFLSSAHKGMRAAQDEIISLVLLGDPLTGSQMCLYRGIVDAMAWQILQGQLCYARRLYKGNPQPDLNHSNFKSVVFCVNNYIKDKPNSIALISDLTSFVQVGDILTEGMGIIEVKEGEKNLRIAEFIHFYLENPCDRALYNFVQQEGPHSLNQLTRMIRQVSRIAHVDEMFTKGIGVDPDINRKVVIPENVVEIDSWYDELNFTIIDSLAKGWAINVIDDCFYIGCYSNHKMCFAGHIIFNDWFDNSGGTPDCPRSYLFYSMQHPLALPIFNLPIPPEHKFDLLFGRMHICMGINIKNLISKCKKVNLEVRFATNKEVSKMDKTGDKPFRYQGKAIIIGNGDIEMTLMDGLFLRVMFHGQKPISLIQSLLNKNRFTIEEDDYFQI